MTETSQSQTNPVIFSITISASAVAQAYQQRLQELVDQAELPGFRKGRAPNNLVEEKVGKKSIYSDTIQKVLPPAYQEEVKKRGLTPLISPRVKALSLDEGKDWQFEIAVVVKPQIVLTGLEEKLKEVLASGKIAVPGKPEPTKDEKMRVAFDAILDTTQVDLPQLLVDEEVNVRLSQLVDQVQAIGMTIEQYMEAKKLTPQTLRASYEKTAREMLKLNLVLDELASQNQFTGNDRMAKTIDWLISH